MRKRIYLYLLITFSIIQTNKVCGTPQYGDILIAYGDTSWIVNNPLEVYLASKGDRLIGKVRMTGGCTALWRGYVATWEIENDSLFLIRIQTQYCGGNPKDVDMQDEFGTNRKYANWYTEKVIQPYGAHISYSRMGSGGIFEFERFLNINNGKTEIIETKSYLIRDDRYVFPNVQFLRDTLLSLILGSISMEERKTFKNNDMGDLVVSFGEDLTISEISFDASNVKNEIMRNTLVSNAAEVLKEFPRLMSISHPNYSPPSLRFFLIGHCLRNPYDRKYGCNDE